MTTRFMIIERKSVLPWLTVGPLLLASFLVGAMAVCDARAAEEDLSRPGDGGAPTPVRINLYLADLYEISGSDQTFLADVVLLAEWQDPRLAGHWSGLHGMDLENVWSPRLQLVNQRGVSSMLPQRIEVDPSGLVRYRQRWWGRFSTRMDMKQFPKDEHPLHVQIASLGYTRDEVELIPSQEKSGRAPLLSITDWDVGQTRMEIADYEPGPGLKPLAGIQMAWDGSRRVGYYAVQVVLPLILIVLMGWTALWVEPSVVTTRMSVSVTTMLTLIAYRFALGRLVPNLTYLTRFDYFMLGSTILIFLMLLVVAAGAYLVGKDRKPLVLRMDRWARPAFLAVFAGVLLLSWWA
jgi:hypothetical protein